MLAAGAVAALAVVATIWLADAVGEHDGPSRWDPVVTSEVVRLRTPVLTDVARALTFAGSVAVLVPAAVLVLGLLLLRRDWRRAGVFAAAAVGAEVFTETVKLVVGRPRPPGVDRIGPPAATNSFPSGHTLDSAVLLALVVWLVWPHLAGVRRAGVAVLALLLAVGVAASRVYLGYHWLTDVTASFLLATAWLVCVWCAALLVSRHRSSAPR